MPSKQPLIAKFLDLRVVRYFLVGGIAAVVDITLFFLFARVMGYNYLIVGAGAFSAAAVVNYMLTIRIVFISGTRFSKEREFFWVYLISFIGLVFNQIILFMAIDILNVEMMVSKLAAIGIVFFWNYLARKHFVFKKSCPASIPES